MVDPETKRSNSGYPLNICIHYFVFDLGVILRHKIFIWILFMANTAGYKEDKEKKQQKSSGCAGDHFKN